MTMTPRISGFVDRVPRQRGTTTAVRRRAASRPPFCMIGLEGCDVEPVGHAEARWMAEQREIIAELCDGSADSATLSGILRRVQDRWSRSAHPADPSTLVAMFGLAVGDLLTRRLPGTGWVVVSDDRRCELALTHAHLPMLVFPLRAVGQQWGSAGPTWLQAYVEQVTESVHAELDAAPQPA